MKLISILVALSAMSIMLAGCPADDAEGTGGDTDTSAAGGDDAGGDDAGGDDAGGDDDSGDNPCGDGGEEGD